MDIGDEPTRMASPGGGEGGGLVPGTLFGQYRILRLLGRGEIGEVYEVEHTVSRRRFALKVPNPELLASREALERSQREAQDGATGAPGD